MISPENIHHEETTMFYRKLPYFAYGSNLNLSQMQMRCKFARDLGPATLDDYELTFRGVADIIPSPGAKVYGGLFQITNKCLRALDAYEGHPHLYGRRVIQVVNAEGDIVPAFAYIMNPTHPRTQVALPASYYFDCIRKGFYDFGLNDRSLWEALDKTYQHLADDGQLDYLHPEPAY